MTWFQKFQQKIWKMIYPFFPYLQRHVLFFHKKGRQKYHIGWLAEGKTLAELKAHLVAMNFGNHFVAWEDTDQVLSWRRLESFKKQYHLRVFTDGEMRGHYELTPESSPIRHFIEWGEAPRTEEFLSFLGDFVTSKKNISRLLVDTTIPTPDSQFTYSDSLKNGNKPRG